MLHAGKDQALSVIFTPTDTTDYAAATDAVSINVDQASLTITADDKPKVYGAALPTLTASYMGFVNGDTSANLTTQPTLVTTATASSHVSGNPYGIAASGAVDSDYTIAYVPGTLTVTAATPTVTWTNPADVVYGTALSSTQLNASTSWTVAGSLVNVPGEFDYTPVSGTVLHAGDHQQLSVVFTPNDATDYTTANKTVLINVLQATPTITWANPADIIYGTALGNAQLDAAASWTVAGTVVNVPGNSVYTPASGTLLHAGNNQQLSVGFTPKDTQDYTKVQQECVDQRDHHRQCGRCRSCGPKERRPRIQRPPDSHLVGEGPQSRFAADCESRWQGGCPSQQRANRRALQRQILFLPNRHMDGRQPYVHDYGNRHERSYLHLFGFI